MTSRPPAGSGPTRAHRPGGYSHGLFTCRPDRKALRGSPPLPPRRRPPGRGRARCRCLRRDEGASCRPGGDPAPVGEKIEFLFVQSFQAGSIAPKEGAEGTYTLTLEHGLGQTIYFSDRPERVVGATPTARFLKGLGFPPDNPPNAALVVEAGPDDTDMVVVELTSPAYDETTHTATYDVTILEEWERTPGVGFAVQPKDLAQLHPEFGAAHLFIDDCSAGQLNCANFANKNDPHSKRISITYCWDYAGSCCIPCPAVYPVTRWEDVCNQWYPDYCMGRCEALLQESQQC